MEREILLRWQMNPVHSNAITIQKKYSLGIGKFWVISFLCTD
jgi:hypothetical protein